MRVLVIASESQQAELSPAAKPAGAEITWAKTPTGEKPNGHIHALIDLQFHYTEERIQQLRHHDAGLFIVNGVSVQLDQLPPGFIRINGWPGFLRGPLLEVSSNQETEKKEVEEIFSIFGKTARWVPDVMGLIAPRVLSMIINEAYFAFQEGVSDKEAIDTAMKLGTNYPWGPFEWSKMIGLKKVVELLSILEKTQTRYKPAESLLKESQLA